MIIRNPIYNSRIIKVYLQFILKNYPEINTDHALQYAGITKYEVEDPAHWFSQYQSDRYHEYLLGKTGNPSISRMAGRFSSDATGMKTVKQYTLGWISPATAYLLMQKLYPFISRGATVKAKKLGSRKVEIISTPNPGVEEKAYQCEYRLGTFESLAKLFTEKFATIEHTECFHKGDDSCRYIITWEKTALSLWKLIRKYSILFGAIASLVLFFLLPTIPWVFFVLLCLFYEHSGLLGLDQ